ncbi:MAG: VanZ family protein [Candidatus Ratteibacteria bacterium]
MKNKKNWIFLIVWMCLIFYFSSIPSVKLPKKFEEEILSYLAHFFEFFILNLLAYKNISKFNLKKLNTFIISSTFSVLYAFSDEVHQAYVPGRDSSEIDFLIDISGVLFLIIFLKNTNSKF